MGKAILTLNTTLAQVMAAVVTLQTEIIISDLVASPLQDNCSNYYHKSHSPPIQYPLKCCLLINYR